MLSPLSLNRLRGLSLIEAVFSTFLLLTALLMAVYIFDSSLKSEVGNQRRIEAALVAESALAEIRDAARRNFQTMKSTFKNRSWNLSSYPGYQVLSTVDSATLSNSCGELESQYPISAILPDPARRLLIDSAAAVTVRVSWTSPFAQSVEVSETLANFREIRNFKVKITNKSGVPLTGISTLSKNQVLDVEVTAEADSQPVKDLQFTWSVEAIKGFGSVAAVSRDGLSCRYRNSYRTFSNKVRYALGPCLLRVQSTYQGKVAKDQIEINNVP